MNPSIRLCLAALSVIAIAGCATPESRIKEKPEVFNSFPPDVQSKVRTGQVDIGYTKDMVYIALGKPDREYTRTTAEGTYEVWSYTDRYTTTERQRITGDFRIVDPQGGFRTTHDTVWADVDVSHEYERLRIEFKNDAVSAIESVNR
jgi:outer membrane protein assembly factor BamE (lipoprotein component of BamABCDE complex)